jgi:hypothetical protein
MYTDSTGHFSILITLILVGFTIAGGIIGGKVAYDNAVSAEKQVQICFGQRLVMFS